MDVNDLRNRFAFHPASTEERKRDHEAIRDACMVLVMTLDSIVPDGRELSLAVTNIEQAMYWANAGAARQPE
ncbi:hypothetical protein AB0K16_22285 [Nonomuraea jabiensis]|uniref:Acb2/Tad1 domain-containing protein n=1 Tax=Nonomuraea jabiensis TaxID=882448 RepID=UPI003427FD93